MAMNIENHVVIISGGGGDIGSTIVKGFVEEKCRIVLCDVNIDAANAVKERFPEAEIETCKVDITNEVSVAELADNVMKKYGHIDSRHGLQIAGAGARRVRHHGQLDCPRCCGQQNVPRPPEYRRESPCV